MPKKTLGFLLIPVFLAIFFICNISYSFDLSRWFPFNKENSLKEWREKIFKGRVIYKVIAPGELGYLSATSDKSASGIFYRMDFNPNKYPLISWQWQVSSFPNKGSDTDIQTKSSWIEADDYAARVYVIFPSFFFMDTKCLEYVWDESLPKGQILTSPYFGNIKLIITESGRAKPGEWVSVERNIVEDYKKAFGASHARKVGAVAIMTDSDNTLSYAHASYKNINVGYKKDEK